MLVVTNLTSVKKVVIIDVIVLQPVGSVDLTLRIHVLYIFILVLR